MMREIEGARGEGKQGNKHPVAKPIRERILAKAMTVHGGIPPNTGLRNWKILRGTARGIVSVEQARELPLQILH